MLIGQAPWALPATTPKSGEWDDLHRLLEASEPCPDFVCMTRALAGSERRLGFGGEPASGGGWHGIARDVVGTHR